MENNTSPFLLTLPVCPHAQTQQSKWGGSLEREHSTLTLKKTAVCLEIDHFSGIIFCQKTAFYGFLIENSCFFDLFFSPFRLVFLIGVRARASRVAYFFHENSKMTTSSPHFQRPFWPTFKLQILEGRETEKWKLSKNDQKKNAVCLEIDKYWK